MTGTRIVTKQQAGDEDLLLGEGQVTQVRNGVPVTVTKQRRVQPVLSQAELDALDTDKYKTALLIDSGTFSLKRATAGGWVTVPAKDYDVVAVTAAVQAALDQSTADAASYAAVAQSEQVSATAAANSAANSALAAAGSASSASTSAGAAAGSALAASQDADDADAARLAAEAAAATAAQHVIDSGVNADDAHDAATLALAHRDNAEAQADLAVSAYRNFRARWYGASATEPTTDPYGEPMTVGDLYFNSTNNFTYVFNGMVWQVASIPPDLIPYMESVRDEVVLLEQQAEASAISAANSATVAANSAATAVANANNSQLSANNSASSATAATNSATAAAGSASTASQDADDAEAARVAAQASALAADQDATAAANSATAAANSATAAANSATAAANSATAASNSQTIVEAAEQDYRGSWYGPLASAPTQDPFGNPVEEGDAYYDTTDKLLKVYDGTAWTLGTVPPGTLGTAAVKDVATTAEALAGAADVLVTAEQTRAVIEQDAPSKTGAGASGTWGISVTGNAATATKLQTARTIGGVSFDGAADINLPGVNTTGNQNTSGNAATATYATSAGSAASVSNTSHTHTTAQILAATAGASAGAVGSYAFLGRSSLGNYSAGQTVAGSTLRYASVTAANSFIYNNTQNIAVGSSGGSGTPSGTWRAMHTHSPTDANWYGLGLWLRIS